MASIVYVKNPNGTVYVYSNESYWDKELKKTKHRRKCIGKLNQETGETVPTRGHETAPALSEKQPGCSSMGLGPSLLLDKAARETGIRDVLESVFRDDTDRILTCAYYLASENRALCHVEQWSAYSIHPFGAQLADQRVSELLHRIVPSLQQDFFSRWMEHGYGKGYFAMDITSVSSYSEFIDFVQWGYNRDGEDLPQINLLMLTSEETHLPVYYRILSGALKDVSSLRESLDNFRLLKARTVRMVMDKGFYSEPNVDAMYAAHYRFSIGVPFTSKLAVSAVEENRADMDSHNNLIQIGDNEVYATTKLTKWKGHRCYIHTYYDSLKAELENKKFIHRLKGCYDELVSGKECAENRSFYARFFIIKDFPKRGRRVQYNEEAIREHRQNTIGWFVLISNDVKDATEALRLYRAKDAVEKNFDNLKNSLDMKRLRIHSNESMSGRIFIQFVALILVAFLQRILDETGYSKNHNLQEVFSELKPIHQVSVEGQRKKLITTPTKRQREILDLFQITL